MVDAAGHSVGFAFVRGEQSAAVRFVGEDPLDVAAEPGAAVFFILIVRQVDIAVGGFSVHRVEVSGPVVAVGAFFRFVLEFQDGFPGVSGHVGFGGQPFQFRVVDPVELAYECRDDRIVVPLEFLGGHRVERHEIHPVGRILGDHAAGAARRPAVFVVQKRFHADFFSFVGHGVGQVEPLLPEVFGLQSDAGVQKGASHTHLFENMKLADQFVFFEPSVPRPERFAPPFVAGIPESRVQRIVAQGSRLSFRVGRTGSRCKCDSEQYG